MVASSYLVDLDEYTLLNQSVHPPKKFIVISQQNEASLTIIHKKRLFYRGHRYYDYLNLSLSLPLSGLSKLKITCTKNAQISLLLNNYFIPSPYIKCWSKQKSPKKFSPQFYTQYFSTLIHVLTLDINIGASINSFSHTIVR